MLADWLGSGGGSFGSPRRFQRGLGLRDPQRHRVGAPSGVLDDFNRADFRRTRPIQAGGGSFGSPRRFQHRTLSVRIVNSRRVGAPSGVLDDFNDRLLKTSERAFSGGGSFGSPRRFQLHHVLSRLARISVRGLLRESSTISTPGRSRGHAEVRRVGAPSGVLDDFNWTTSSGRRLSRLGGGSFGSPRRFQP